MSDGLRAIFVRVEGRVQGVGYRAFARDQARQLGVEGWVTNRADGSVEAALRGPGDKLGEMIARLRQGPPAAEVTSLDVRSSDVGRVAEAPEDGAAF